jgi:hypothetical protein
MSELVFVDDATALRFDPFALTRPISELRAGALLIRERCHSRQRRRPTYGPVPVAWPL